MAVDRRNLPAAGTIAGLTAAGPCSPRTSTPATPGTTPRPATTWPRGGKYKAVEEASAQCVTAGQESLRHCLDSFAAGDTALAGRAKSARRMLAVTAALQDLAAADSGHVPAFAREARTVCLDCEKECRRHAEHHATCKACAEACGKAAAYEKVAAWGASLRAATRKVRIAR